MAVVLYQRSEPRHKEWLPLLSQQIRLRNLTQILLINVPQNLEGQLGYFTLHVSPMSAPYYTSTKVPFVGHQSASSSRCGSSSSSSSGGGGVTQWPEIQLSLCSTRLSASSTIVRVWTGSGSPVISWGVHFKGLHHLGHIKNGGGVGGDEWGSMTGEFFENTLIFVTPFGSFTSLSSLISPPVKPQRFLQIKTSSDSPPPRSSYTLQKLVSLHHYQRSVLEEHALAEKLKMDIGMHGFGVGSSGDTRQQPTLLSERLILRAKLGRQKLRLKEEAEVVAMKVKSLIEEKGRAEGRIRRLKQDTAHYEELGAELVNRMHNFTTEKTNLKETKAALISRGQALGKFRASVFLRKKQLISELLHIYPLDLIEVSKKYSINGVQLPNAEDYGNETGGQISVALGYTAHLTAMLAFFLDIPCRYPIRHFGSRSRIIDHITVQIPDKEREFPLYFKGKRDVYCAYAIYLLNKNVAQLRWYCGLSTPDLRATLPNLVELLSSRLVIPGWPPNIGDALEIAQEITEDIDSNFLENPAENELTMSLDKGLDKMMAIGENADSYNISLNSLSDENPGGNSTALGDIQHGRGQDRFLSGWKKKTYIETDDFDPKWLMDSMNLDFETGRKISMSNSSPPPRPIFIITDDNGSIESGCGSKGMSSPSSTRRMRRMGQVDAPKMLNNLAEGRVDESQSDLRRNQTPSREIVRLELDIKEFERRKSRGTATSLGIPSSSDNNAANVIMAMADNTVNKQQGLLPPVSSSSSISPHSEWIIESNTAGTDNDEVRVQHTEICNPTYHIPPPVVVVEQSLMEPDIKKEDEEMTEKTTSQSQNDENCDNNSSSTLDTDSSKLHKRGKVVDGVGGDNNDNTENSLLWMRTEALLGSQSFNLVRRRMSTSEST